jgi:hypothetical protein|tara:strand:- start:216 stop:416 length:201 start_codon:yes stop_codon:yes gene_type:complete
VLPAIGVLQIPTKTKRVNQPVKLAQVQVSKQTLTASAAPLATKQIHPDARKENILPQLSPNVPIVP